MRDREKERNIRLPESYVQQGGPVRPPRPSPAPAAPPRARGRSRPAAKDSGGVPCCAGCCWACCACFWPRASAWGAICMLLRATTFCGWIWSSCRTGRRPSCMRRTGKPVNGWSMPGWRPRSRRYWVPLSEIPEDMQHAFVAIEDKHFTSITALPCTRTGVRGAQRDEARAHRHLFRRRGRHQAGRLHHRPAARQEPDAGRRAPAAWRAICASVREIWRALSCCDAKYDKETILEAYLNVISFTDNTAGVQAESIKLFGKSAKDLSSWPSAPAMAAITKNPSRYDPRHPCQKSTWPAATTFCTRCGSRAISPRTQYNAGLGRARSRISPGNVPVAETHCHHLFHRQAD